MRESYVVYQGKILDESQVSISVRNMAFNYGLGCFEGIRAFWNDMQKQLYVFRMKDHYCRLLNSCKILHIDIPFTACDLCKQTLELLRKSDCCRNVYIRPIAFKGSNREIPQLIDPDNRIVIYYTPMEITLGREVFSTKVSSWSRVGNTMIPPWAKPTAAYLNSALATTEAVLNGYDEAILLTRDGHVSEGPGENIFIVRDGALITPPASDDILEGITRDTVMLIARNELGMRIIERSLPRVELYSADEVFFTGTVIGIKPIVEIDRRIVSKGYEGIITRTIRNIYNNITFGNDFRYIALLTPVY